MSKSTEKNNGFRNFLQSKLSYEDYVALRSTLGISRRSLNLLLDHPETGNNIELLEITTLIRKKSPDFKTEYLISNYNFGLGKRRRSASKNTHI